MPPEVDPRYEDDGAPELRPGDGRHCPGCAGDIGIGAIFRAGLPNMIRCPHCGERVRYEGAGGLLAVLVVLLAAVSYVAYELSERVFPMSPLFRLVAFTALLLAAWAPIEIAAVIA